MEMDAQRHCVRARAQHGGPAVHRPGRATVGSALALVVAAVMPGGLLRWERDGARLWARGLAYLFHTGGPVAGRRLTPRMATTSWRCLSPRSACGAWGP